MSEFSSVESIVSNSVPPRTVYVLFIKSKSRKNYIQITFYNQLSPWSFVLIFHATIPGISSILTKSQ